MYGVNNLKCSQGDTRAWAYNLIVQQHTTQIGKSRLV
jgi:hypothetical protein